MTHWMVLLADACKTATPVVIIDDSSGLLPLEVYHELCDAAFEMRDLVCAKDDPSMEEENT